MRVAGGRGRDEQATGLKLGSGLGPLLCADRAELRAVDLLPVAAHAVPTSATARRCPAFPPRPGKAHSEPPHARLHVEPGLRKKKPAVPRAASDGCRRLRRRPYSGEMT